MAPSIGHNMVTIGTHSIFLRSAGIYSPGVPAIIGIAGLGSDSTMFTAVLRHISPFARGYSYDRTGLGNSQVPVEFKLEDKSSVNMARELKLLLERADIKPPYILVMHSMGGLPGREFLHLYPDEVVGMVFVDCITEENCKSRPKEVPRTLRAMQEGLDMSFLWSERIPDMTDEELNETLSSEGYGEVSISDERKEELERAIMFEVQNLETSSEILAKKRQFEFTPMGDKPVSVIKGDAPGEFRRIFEKAVEAGKGTELERKLMSDYLATADDKQLMMQRQQLRLSRNSRFVVAERSWHNVPWYEPELVAGEVKWCIDEYEKSE